MMQLVLVVTAAYVTGVTLEQPNPCQHDSQCTAGFYCHTDVFQCQACLQCEDLGREPPETKVKCIKSVVECGPCSKGLITDRLGVGCTGPAAGKGPFEGGWSTSEWVWAGSILVAVIAFVCAGLIYALRNVEAIKFTTRTSVRAPVLCGGGGGAGDAGAPAHYPSAPAPAPTPSVPSPPPYFPHTANRGHPAHPVSPPPDAYHYAEESSAPLVKRRGSERGEGGAGGGGGARESAGSQAARVYSHPNYVRNVPPPSYESAFSDESDHESPFVPLDEETVESVWTPGLPNGNVNGNEDVSPTTLTVEQETASGPLVPARRADRTEASPPPGKIRRVEDTNNNEGGGPSSHPPNPPPSQPPPAPPAPSFVINVLNVNSVHQLNDVSL